MNRERLWLYIAGGSVILLTLAILIPSRKEEQPKLWSIDWTGLEFTGPKGLVQIDKASGWYADQFFIRLPDRRPRLASTSVKSFFIDMQNPAIKGEYLLSEKEAGEIFEQPRCITLRRSSERREICAGRVSAGQTFVRLKDEPLRAYMMPEYIFGRVNADPEAWIEKRVIILPSGTVPQRISVWSGEDRIELVRKKEKVEGGDRMHWYAGEREVSLNFVNNLLSALYDLQRDRLAEEAIPSATPLIEIEVDAVTESPSIEGIFRGAFGSGKVRASLFAERETDDQFFYPVIADGGVDLVGKARVDRLLAAWSAVKNAPPVAPPGAVPGSFSPAGPAGPIKPVFPGPVQSPP